MAQTRFAHDLEGLVVTIGTGIDGPGDAQRFEQFRDIAGMLTAGGEGVIIEGEFPHLRDVVNDPFNLVIDVFRRAEAHLATGKGLWPQAVDTLGWAATAGVDRDVGVLKVRDHIL